MTSAVTTVATSSSALMTTSTLPSSTRSIYSARIPAPATSRPLMSGRQLVMEDPDVSTVRQIVQELSETVEVLVDFEWQPFQTAVPPPQYPYAFGEDPPVFVESMPDPITAHVEDVGEPDVTDDSNDEEGKEGLTTIGEETGDDTETGISYQQDANDEAFEEPRVEPDAPVVEAGSTEKTGHGSDELCGEYEPEPPSSVPEAGGFESVDPVDDDPVSTSYDTAVCGAKPVAESFDDESVPVIANDVSSQPSDEDNVAPPSDPEADVSSEAVQCLQEKPISAPVDLTDIGRIPKPKPGPLPALKSRKELSPVKLKPTKAHQQCHQRKLPERNLQVRRPTRKQAPPPKRVRKRDHRTNCESCINRLCRRMVTGTGHPGAIRTGMRTPEHLERMTCRRAPSESDFGPRHCSLRRRATSPAPEMAARRRPRLLQYVQHPRIKHHLRRWTNCT